MSRALHIVGIVVHNSRYIPRMYRQLRRNRYGRAAAVRCAVSGALRLRVRMSPPRSGGDAGRAHGLW